MSFGNPVPAKMTASAVGLFPLARHTAKQGGGNLDCIKQESERVEGKS